MKTEVLVAIDLDEALDQLYRERRTYRSGIEPEAEQRYNFAISVLESLPTFRAVQKKDYDALLAKYEELKASSWQVSKEA